MKAEKMILILLLLGESNCANFRDGANYKQYRKYSPFYLRNHPEERTQGDIADIQIMAVNDSDNDLQGVENVFEKNAQNFEKLMQSAQ